MENQTTGASRWCPKHPVAAFFHVAFKVVALLTYLTMNWFFSDYFVVGFVVITLLLAFDFWTVKNVTGRLLVGLRWWNEVNEDGTTKWRFESAEGKQVNEMEKLFFWITMLITLVLWVLFAVFNVLGLRFETLLLTVVAIALTLSNLIGYFKCAKDAGQQMRNYATQMIVQQATRQALSGSSSTNENFV